MKRKYLILTGVLAVMLTVGTSIALASAGSLNRSTTLPEAVRQVTAQFKDVDKAEKAGYGLLHGCVSGPQEGAMGIHFANGDLVGDGVLDVQHPEALLYESKDGKLQLT